MGRKTTITDKRQRRYIRINNVENWNWIDKIMEVQKYKNSFSALIEDALTYGLPLLYESLFGEVILSESKFTATKNNSVGLVNEEIVQLLKEIVINSTVNKAILSSIFNLEKINTQNTLLGKKFADGALSDTPEFIEGFEINALINLKKGGVNG